jgi:hypothetical protein
VFWCQTHPPTSFAHVEAVCVTMSNGRPPGHRRINVRGGHAYTLIILGDKAGAAARLEFSSDARHHLYREPTVVVSRGLDVNWDNTNPSWKSPALQGLIFSYHTCSRFFTTLKGR